MFANSETETSKESCIIHFPTIPPCSTKVDVHETGDVSILFSLSQMKNLGTTVELDAEGDKITAMGHIVLDLTSLAHQPTTKSREHPGYPKRHVTFAMSERRPTFVHQTWMKIKMRMINRLCGQHQGKEPAQEKRDRDTDEEDLLPLVPRSPPAAPVRKSKRPPVSQNPAATLEHEVPEDSRERAENTSIWCRKAEKQKVKLHETS